MGYLYNKYAMDQGYDFCELVGIIKKLKYI